VSRKHVKFARYEKPLRIIANEAGAFSRATAYRWLHKDMSDEAVAGRMEKAVPPRLLSPELQRVAAGWVVARCAGNAPTGTDDIRAFLLAAFGLDPIPSWISKWAQRHHLSSRRTQAQVLRKLGEKEFDEAVQFLREVRALHLEPEHIVCLDKTGV
jgi:hypothetical protein